MTTKLLANGETYIHGLFTNLDVIQASRLLVLYSMEEYIGNQQKLLNRIIGMNLKIPVFS